MLLLFQESVNSQDLGQAAWQKWLPIRRIIIHCRRLLAWTQILSYVPSLPGCISEGETVEEALANIREAIELFLEPDEKDGIKEETSLERLNAEIGIGLEQAERGELIDAAEIKFDDLLSEATNTCR